MSDTQQEDNIKIDDSKPAADKTVKNPKKDLKKFLLKLFIFFIAINLPTFIYFDFFQMNYGYIDCPMWKYSKDFIKGKINSGEPDPKLLIMGDSRAMAGVIPGEVSDSANSLCLTGGSTVEIYYMIKDYLKNHTAPKAIFCSVSPNHLETHTEFFYRAVNYKFLSSMQVLEILNKARELNDYPFKWREPMAGNYFLEFFLYRMDFILYYKAELTAGQFYKRREPNLQVYNSLKSSLGYMNFSPGSYSSDLNEEAKTPVFKPSPLLTYYLEKVFDLCAKNNIKIIYQTMPMNEASYAALTREYTSGYTDCLQKMQNKYPSAVISSEIVQFTNDCFGDNSHLNGNGAKKMSQYIKEKYFPDGVQ